MSKNYIILLLLLLGERVMGQELYVFSEPASNMPANSISVKLTDHFVTDDNIYGQVFTSLYAAGNVWYQ